MAAAEIKLNFKNPEIFRDKAYVNGQWIEAGSGKRFEIIDPGSGKAWATCPDMAASDVDSAVEAAYTAFQAYRKVNPQVRSDILYKWHSLMLENLDDLAAILVYEAGKPLAEARGEVAYSAGIARWFAGEAERIQGTVFAPGVDGLRVATIKQPLGVAAALVPWNFPIAMIIRKASACLAAGCTMICKPSPETPLSALTLAYLAEKAGLPAGVLNILPTTMDNTPSLSEALCKHPKVKKVTFTGSTRVGKLLAGYCADQLKKLTLELGGNCPALVFDDADLDQVCAAIMPLKFRNAGQACVAANRIYVQKGIYDKLSAMLAEKVGSLKVGHGMDKGTTMGPITSPAGVAKTHAQVEDAKKHGGKVLKGGNKIDLNGGYFFEPTLITGAHAKMRVAQEETFGPLMALFPFDTEDDAVEAANNTTMGLASYVFTKSVDRTWRLMENLEAGMIGLNAGTASTCESPFGGIKDSGFGKESGKDVAVSEYLISKTVVLALEGI